VCVHSTLEIGPVGTVCGEKIIIKLTRRARVCGRNVCMCIWVCVYVREHAIREYNHTQGKVREWRRVCTREIERKKIDNAPARAAYGVRYANDVSGPCKSLDVLYVARKVFVRVLHYTWCIFYYYYYYF